MGITMTISDQLKAEIERSGLSIYRIAKDAGIRPEVLYRFREGRQTLKLETVDLIAPVLNLELRRKGKRRR